MATPSERQLNRILPKGYSTIRSGRGGHIRIISPRGELVRFKAGPKYGLPVSVSCSPGNGNWIREVIRDLIAAGVKVRG
jgi:hypothetical protein